MFNENRGEIKLKILRKLPKWAAIALVVLIFALIAGNLVQHMMVRGRVSEQRQRIQQQQEHVSQVINEKRTDGRFWFDKSAEN